MSRDEKRRQKALMKKRRKDRQRTGSNRKDSFTCHSDNEYYFKKRLIKNAREFPIYECLINPEWQEHGIAQILISRKQPNGRLVFGLFLVDIFCLGIKNTFSNANISFEEYENSFKPRMCMGELSFSDCHPRLAHRIIYGAIEYASSLGFKPQKDFELSRFILDEPSEIDSSFDVEFGKDGKPFYTAGPDDNVDYIMKKLSMNLGEGNFTFLHSMEI